eukprot:TRINITY_DN1517_c0_g1_i1.p1 TRINITY_DN1517_c0_g1~~TRINITY_DN1517_c0_g1_i1.p1  ORF type:complete len:338 (-),score=105.97 TRINITY_DN1517_c0_g1_i1:13-1026(-)
MTKTAERKDPELWEEVKEKVTEGDKGGAPGQWSARKAQLAVKEYKQAGGEYVGKKSDDNSLTKWSKEEWTTKSGENSSETGERYLPKKVIENMSDEEYERSSEKKREDTDSGRQFSEQPADVQEHVSDLKADLDQEIDEKAAHEKKAEHKRNHERPSDTESYHHHHPLHHHPDDHPSKRAKIDTEESDRHHEHHHPYEHSSDNLQHQRRHSPDSSDRLHQHHYTRHPSEESDHSHHHHQNNTHIDDDDRKERGRKGEEERHDHSKHHLTELDDGHHLNDEDKLHTTIIDDVNPKGQTLRDLTKEELMHQARDLHIPGRSKMNKDDLVEAIAEETGAH